MSSRRHEGADFDAIKAAAEKVSTASSALGAAMYQEQAAAGDAGPGADAGAGASAGDSQDDDVVDAEIVDGDEKNDPRQTSMVPGPQAPVPSRTKSRSR